MNFNLTKKPDLVLIVMEFFSPQLHSKSGFINDDTLTLDNFVLF